MKKTKLSLLILIVMLTNISWSLGKKYATVLIDVSLVENPGSAKPKYVPDSLLKRGEFVIIKDSKDVKGKTYLMVQIDGVEISGWLEDRWVHEGKLESYTILKDTDLYTRPNAKSPTSGRARAGQMVFVFEEKEPFAKIQYPNVEAYVSLQNIAKSKESSGRVVKTVTFTDMGSATVSSSSQYSSGLGKEMEFDVRNLFDNNLQTAWCEGKADDEGIGEYITITFSEWVTLNKISIVSGWTKSEEIYKMNSRPSKIRIVGNHEAKMELQNENYDYQTMDNQSIGGNTFTFYIDGIHSGRDKDTCISEIKLEGTRGGAPMEYQGY